MKNLLRNSIKNIFIFILLVSLFSCNFSKKQSQEIKLKDIYIHNRIKTLHTGSAVPEMSFKLSIPNSIGLNTEWLKESGDNILFSCMIITKDSSFQLYPYNYEQLENSLEVSLKTKFYLFFKSLKEMDEILDNAYLTVKIDEHKFQLDINQDMRKYFLDEVLIEYADSTNMNAKEDIMKFLDDYNVGNGGGFK